MISDAMRAYQGWFPLGYPNKNGNTPPTFAEWESAWKRNQTPAQQLLRLRVNGHGHVFKNSKVARCGGLGLCNECFTEHLLVQHAMKVGYLLGSFDLAVSYTKLPSNLRPPRNYPEVFDPVHHLGHGVDFKLPGLHKHAPMQSVRLTTVEDILRELLTSDPRLMGSDDIDQTIADKAAVIRSIVRGETIAQMQLIAPKFDISSDLAKGMQSAAKQVQDAMDAFVKAVSHISLPPELQPTERKDHD